jgi:hypothetical protein
LILKAPDDHQEPFYSGRGGFLGRLLRLDIQVIVGAVGVGGGHRPAKVALIFSLLDGLPIEGMWAAVI